MDEVENWARAAFRQAHLDVDDDDVAFVQLIYAAAIAQLHVLDQIDPDEFPVRAIDPSHAPE